MPADMVATESLVGKMAAEEERVQAADDDRVLPGDGRESVSPLGPQGAGLGRKKCGFRARIS